MSPPRRFAFLAALFLLAGIAFLCYTDAPRPLVAESSKRTPTSGTIPLARSPGIPPVTTSTPLRPQLRKLVAAMDKGEPVNVLIDGREPRTFLVRPRTLLADNFRISLGAGSAAELPFDPQIIRVYEGRGLTPGSARLASRASFSIIDNALAAVISEEDGSVTRLRTDDATGEILTLREEADARVGTCSHDLAQGIATVTSDREAATDADWLAGPRALVEIATADEPEIADAGGINPGTQRLDKYVDPLPFGRNYDLSLKDMLVLVVLDKDATGANTETRLTNVTSEYLARMANVAAVHEHQLGIRLLVQELILTPNTAEFTDIPPALADFRAWVDSNRQRGTYLWNAATKFGNTATDGGTIGVGYVSALSGSYGVSVCNKGFSHALVAHEMGHNMGSGHSGGGIMNASIIVGSRDFFVDVSAGETAAKDIYDHTSSRIFGDAPMRHPEQIPFAKDDDRTTAVNTPHIFNPVANDANSVLNGTTNSVVTLEEISRVQPLSAGTAAITGPNQVTFTPTPGFQGMAWLSYSIRGNVGNGGKGWLHKGDAAVQVGSFNADSLNITLAQGQVFSFRPSGGGDPTIQSQPQYARVDTSRDDRQLIIVRVQTGATGTDSFVFRKNGSDSTVNITYLPVSQYLVASPDVFFFDGSNPTVTFNPLVNDQGGGYLSPVSINAVTNGSSGGQTITYYFRHRFTLNNPAEFTGLNLDLLRDDGAIVYLNGTELVRDNMPAGPVTSATLASASVGGAAETTYFPFNNLPATALAQGLNVLAVELHQSSVTSSDAGFDLSLVATGPGGSRTLVPRQSEWRYLDDGSDQGTAWNATSFNDGDAATIIGYGPDPSNKFITTYFRKSFNVANPATFTNLTVRARRDDGVVLYLNGSEIVRNNMPSGTITDTTFSAAGAADNGANFLSFTVPASALISGTNVIAAEIHQTAVTSSDIVFDLDLAGNTAGGAVYLIAAGDTWKYLDNGSNQGTAWRAGAFNDSTWSSGHGPLGYPLSVGADWPRGTGLLGFGDNVETTTLRVGTEARRLLPGAFRVVSATNLTPAKGALTFNETLRFTVDNASGNARTGLMSFTPSAGASGVATIEYVIEDGAGNRTTGTATIILALVEITSPVSDSIILDIRNELLLEGTVFNGGQAPLSGVVTPSWSLVSSPEGGTVTFSAPGNTSTRARFNLAGEYVLRLTGTDNGLSTSENRRVLVTDGSTILNGLAGWWALDETTGTATIDASGNGHHGFRVGAPTPDTGIIGGGLSFDATNRYVDFSLHAPAFNDLAVGTLSVWFRTNTGSNRTLFSASDSGDGGHDLRLFMEDGLLKFKVRGDVGTDEAGLRSTMAVNDNVWHHAAVTVDAARNAILYVDGVPSDSGVRPFFNGVLDIDVIRIGQTVNAGAATAFYRGSVDDLRIYERVLAADEITLLASAAVNHAPLITLPRTLPVTGGSTLALSLLSPTVADDGLPANSLGTLWQSRSGPAIATFSNAGNLAGNVTFPTPGSYVLELRASDGAATTVDAISINYSGEGPDVPFALGLPDLVVHENAPDSSINLFTAFQDAQDPDSALLFTLTGNTNPALFSSVTISGTSPRNLVLDYAPAATGSSRLTVRATDTSGLFTETPFTVTVENFAPSIPNQRLTVPENSAPGTLVGTLGATDPDGDAMQFTILSGNADGLFSLGRSTGEIRVSGSGTLDFETASAHSLVVAVTDPAHPAFTSTATVLINVSDVNEQPEIRNSFLTVAEGTPAGTVVASLTAIDPDGSPLAFAIIGGNTSGAFALDRADGFLTVANPSALNLNLNPQFVLTVRVLDDGTPALSDTAEIRLTIARTLVAERVPARALVPTSNAVDTSWRALSFNDASWSSGTTGIGYDTDPDYDPLIGLDVETGMSGINGSVYVRVPFNLTGTTTALGSMNLGMKYDDGFVASLNGQEIARANAPANLAWNSTASAGHNDDDAQIFENFDASTQLGSLLTGSNVLAIHGLNTSINSSDLLILPQLTVSALGSPALPAPPQVTLSPATAITSNSALLHGTLVESGGTSPGLTFVWGSRDGGDDPARWDHSMPLGTQIPGAYAFTVTGLPTGRSVLFNLIASHSGGTVAAAAPESFVTLLGDSIVLLAEGANAYGFVPVNASAIDSQWRERGFNPAGWRFGPFAAGYEDATGYQNLLSPQLDFRTAMLDTNATIYLRAPFTPANPQSIGRLLLRMKYDDGFVAYLNGIEVARRNAFDGPQVWNSAASGQHADAEAILFEDIDISGFAGLLANGENILAIHGLNDGVGSSDMLISPALLGYIIEDTDPTALYNAWATGTHGLSGTNALVTADPDNDRRNNLLEYATGSDPRNGSDSGATLTATFAGNRLHIAYHRRIDAALRGLTYRVETFTSGAWQPGTIEATESVVTDPNGLTENVTLRLANTDPATAPTTLARIAVDYSP